MAHSTSRRTSLIVSVLGLVVAVGALLFGNSVIDRLSGPDVVVQRTVADIPWPETAKEVAECLAGPRTMGQLIERLRPGEARPASPPPTAGGPEQAPTPDLAAVADKFREALPNMSQEEVLKFVATAYMLHAFGVMHAAMTSVALDKGNRFPDKVITLRIVNLGGKIARNVDIVVRGDFQIVEQTVNSPLTGGAAGEEMHRPGGAPGTKITYHFDRMPAGEDHSSLVTLWVDAPKGAPTADEHWLSIAVVHDNGKGAGRVVGGVATTAHSDFTKIGVTSVAFVAAVAMFLATIVSLVGMIIRYKLTAIMSRETLGNTDSEPE